MGHNHLTDGIMFGEGFHSKSTEWMYKIYCQPHTHPALRNLPAWKCVCGRCDTSLLDLTHPRATYVFPDSNDAQMRLWKWTCCSHAPTCYFPLPMCSALRIDYECFELETGTLQY
jgi:hypothetical protein